MHHYCTVLYPVLEYTLKMCMKEGNLGEKISKKRLLKGDNHFLLDLGYFCNLTLNSSSLLCHESYLSNSNVYFTVYYLNKTRFLFSSIHLYPSTEHSP